MEKNKATLCEICCEDFKMPKAGLNKYLLSAVQNI